MTAAVPDRGGGRWPPGGARRPSARVRGVVAGSGFGGRLQDLVRRACRRRVTITRGAAAGFATHARGWAVGRTFGRLAPYRRLMADREYLPGTSAAVIQAAMIHLIPNRMDW